MSTFFEKIKYSIFPFLEFKKKNLSFLKKVYISLNTLMMLTVISFISIYLFSSFFYSYRFKTKNITIYSNTNIADDEKFIHTLKDAEKTLKNNTLYNKNYAVQIYLVDSNLLYNFMATPFHMDTIAINILDYISIRNKDIELSKNKYHALSKEIQHEVIHTLQAMKYGGWIQSKFTIPYWVSEGYAEYIEENKLVHHNPKEFLDTNKERKNYTLYALMVKHAIEDLNKSIDDLHLGKLNYNNLLSSIFKEYNITK